MREHLKTLHDKKATFSSLQSLLFFKVLNIFAIILSSLSHRLNNFLPFILCLFDSFIVPKWRQLYIEYCCYVILNESDAAVHVLITVICLLAKEEEIVVLVATLHIHANLSERGFSMCFFPQFPIHKIQYIGLMFLGCMNHVDSEVASPIQRNLVLI